MKAANELELTLAVAYVHGTSTFIGVIESLSSLLAAGQIYATGIVRIFDTQQWVLMRYNSIDVVNNRLTGLTTAHAKNASAGASGYIFAIGSKVWGSAAADYLNEHFDHANPHPVLERLVNKGVAGGYAPLDAGAIVPTAHLGSGAGNTRFLRGDRTWAFPTGAVEVIYNESGVWTKADYPGATMAFIEAWGGGGSGGRGSGITGRGGGGGGGGYMQIIVPLTLLGATETVTVGAGGAVQTAAGNGFVGGNSLFGTRLTAFGGGGGGGSTATAHNAGGGGGGALGAGGSAVAATVGAGGAPSIAAQVNVGFGGGPGGLPTAGGFGAVWGGGGGAGGNVASPGGASLYGGGGGGGTLATSPGGTSRYGGAGGAGVADLTAGNTGLAPGGGGSGSSGANSGAGAAGRVRVLVW